MKKIYLFICVLGLMSGSCSMDDVLDASEDLNVSVIETNNPIKAEPGDTVFFRFVVSTSKGEVSRVQITSEDGIQAIVSETSFALIDKNIELSLSQDGYFSRAVSTVLVTYPLIIPDDPSLRGKSLFADLKVTRDDGRTKNLKQEFEIIKYINNPHGITMSGKNAAWLYNPTDNVVYDKTDYREHLGNIDLILYVDGNSKYFCLNPAAAETETIMQNLGYIDYKAPEMNNTKFMGNITLNFTLVTEKELSEIAMKNEVDQLAMGNNAVCAFTTRDGRKGLAKHLYKSPNRSFVTKMQISQQQ